MTNTAQPVGSFFGASVALSSDGTAALVTAPGVNSKRGAAYIFGAPSEGAWVSSSAPTATLTDAGSRLNGLLGVGSSLSADGATALLGAPGYDLNTGATDVFHASDANSWTTSSTPNAILTDKALAACVVPKLKGLKVAVARKALAIGRCRLGKATRVHSKTKQEHGRVLSQSKKPGKRLAISTRVAVSVGK
jgi:hypothetical protein